MLSELEFMLKVRLMLPLLQSLTRQQKLPQKQKLSQKDYDGVKIADIVFSFNNADLILALRARG